MTENNNSERDAFDAWIKTKEPHVYYHNLSTSHAMYEAWQAALDSASVVLPERMNDEIQEVSTTRDCYSYGWNTCLDAIRASNPGVKFISERE